MLVKWADAWADHDETTPNDFVSDCLVETVGYLLRDGAVLSIAQERLHGGKTYRCVTHIPRVLLVGEVRYL